MNKFAPISRRLFLFLVIIGLKISIDLSHTSANANPLIDDAAMTDFNDPYQQQRRHTDQLDNLRRFLLTSNAEQRAQRREQLEAKKRELIREYLRSLEDSDENHAEEVKKRFKTYCNSFEDPDSTGLAACG